MKKQTLILLISIIILIFSGHIQAFPGEFKWKLRATGFQQGHAYAVFEHLESGEKKWVGVGETFEEGTIIRVDRFQTMVDTPMGRKILNLGDIDEDAFPPLITSLQDQAPLGMDVNEFLSEDVMQSLENPFYISETERSALVKEFKRVYNQGKVKAVSKVIVMGGGEELIKGIQTTLDVPGMRFEEEDLIIMVNGLLPEPEEKRWENLLGVIQKAKILIFAYEREGKISSKIYQVNN